MTRGRFYGIAMPIWAILYVVGMLASHNHHFNALWPMGFALIALIGIAIHPGDGRDRRRNRTVSS